MGDYAETLELFQWADPDPRPKLNTREDYVRAFSRNLVGSWSNDRAMMPNPMSKDVIFDADGTGAIQGAFFTAFSGTFEWREQRGRVIEVRAPGEPETWHPISWEFHGDESVLHLDYGDGSTTEDEYDSLDSELILDLISDPLVLSDRRSWDDSPRIKPVPSDAEPISIGGAPAWISHGSTEQSTFWRLHQPPYEVMVANSRGDERESHLVTLTFVAPKTGKRMVGHCADADGHLDRERFLVVAEGMLRALRDIYG